MCIKSHSTLRLDRSPELLVSYDSRTLSLKMDKMIVNLRSNKNIVYDKSTRIKLMFKSLQGYLFITYTKNELLKKKNNLMTKCGHLLYP